MNLESISQLFISQKFEKFELFGFETRNKYSILDAQKQPVAFAAEQQKGVLGFLFRQYLGHWRKFDIQFFDQDKQPFMNAHHPFKFFFQRFEITYQGKYIGALQQRFGIFSKKFDIEDAQGNIIMNMNSGFFKFWTFPILQKEIEVAKIQKKWSGGLTELFTDKDTFMVELGSTLNNETKLIILAAAIFVDLQYFENKAD